jgi:hypothetical protein
MPSEECPRCGAVLRIETRGELLDKIQVCLHCGFERDILDEVTIEQEEAGKRVRIHRKDLGNQDVTHAMLGDADMQAKVREATGMDMADLLKNAHSIQSSGKNISRSTTTTQTYSGDEARQKMAEMGFNLDSMPSDSNTETSVHTVPGASKSKWTGWILLAVMLGGLGALGWFLQ